MSTVSGRRDQGASIVPSRASFGEATRRSLAARINTTGRLACLALAIAFAAPAAVAGTSEPVRSMLEIRQHSVVVQKFDLSCGAAALATLLNYQFGDHVTEKDVTRGLIRRKEYIEHPELVRIRQGFSLLDLKRYVATRGYVGIGYGHLEMSDLVRLAPIIVAVHPFGYNHFVIFKGLVGDRVVIADPAYGNRTMSREKFEKLQINFPQIGKVGFIVTRGGRQAPPGELTVQQYDLIFPSGDLLRQVISK
jgi:predicted double-glycine peptidase